MKKVLFLAAALAVAISFASCDKNNNNEGKKVKQKVDISVLDPIVKNYADVVVLPTYKHLKECNDALFTAVSELCANPTDKNFEKAAEAWLTAREPWEKSEAFLFGPVAALGLDPNMDSWPLDQSGIEQILQSGDWKALEWSKESEAEAAQNVRGFHTLEYLLFKDGKARTTSDEDYKKVPESWCNYMKAVANLLKKDATDLYNAWSVSYKGGEAYINIFRNHSNGTYPTALACIEEILDGCSEIADEVGNAKIGGPYNLYQQGKKEEALYAVESWYSWHSKEDYTNNIYSIRNAYYGTLDGKIAQNSISTLVKGLDEELDTEVKNAINAAVTAIQLIPTPLRNHINSKESEAAMAACKNLDEVLKKLKANIREFIK